MRGAVVVRSALGTPLARLAARIVGTAALPLMLAGFSIERVPVVLPDRAAAADLMNLEIAGRAYAIPRAYIANVATNHDGSIQHVRLSVLWPSLEPLSEENRHLQKPSLPGRQIISIIISPEVMEGYQQLQRMIEVGWLDPKHEPGPFGLEKYEKPHPGRKRTMRHFASADETYRTPMGQPIVFDCDDLFSWDAQQRMKLEPICTVEYSLQGGGGLYYRIYRANLKHWREIDGAVRKLVASFRRNPGN